MAKVKRKWRWVIRDEPADLAGAVEVLESVTRPTKNASGFWCGHGDYVVVCADEFKALFGFCPKPGECIKVEFSAKVLSEEPVT